MTSGARAFSARVKLPCRLFCGGKGGPEVSATAVSIDTGSAVLAIPEGPVYPKLGEAVRLELQLPGKSPGSRCLAVRARVAKVVELRNGTSQMTVEFRKAAFKESDKPQRKPPKSVANGWRM
jgi:hypothetical protein